MPDLYPYQQELLKEAESGLESPEARLMLQLPTGGGKTIIAGELLARRLKANPNSAAVWLTHRRELADQTRKMLREAGVTAESRLPWPIDAPRVDNGVAILTAQTVDSREPTWTKYGDNDLLVVDEAHHAAARSWKKPIEWWPGPVLGMTATPWRLSVKEGFDHLFKNLILGPQVHQLQDENYLCLAQVRTSDEEGTFLGDNIEDTGDYSQLGIRDANIDRPVWTQGVFHFWHNHAANRQTIIYAVSIEHADNLEKVFVEAGISAKVIHAKTLKGERARIFEAFRKGTHRVLINVAIFTEGFDLPDASCVVIARPTLSLSLYLQMVGRGLRLKPDRSEFQDCLILDMAGNAERHGMPEDEREWSLKARGDFGTGNAPVVLCEECGRESAAARRSCVHCGEPFGKECERCGKWRAWKWWEYEAHCGKLHDLVCDLCHYDVHIKPVSAVPGQPPVLGEIHQLMEARISELQGQIQRMDFLLKPENKNARDKEFGVYLTQLKDPPNGYSDISEEFQAWMRQLETNRGKWRLRLSRIESGNPDDLEILEKTHQSLQAILPQPADIPGNVPPAMSGTAAIPVEPADAIPGGRTLRLTTWVNASDSLRVKSLQPPTGPAIPVEKTNGILIAVTEWLIKQGHISRKDCPILQSASAKVKCLINAEPYHLKGSKKSPAKFTSPVELSNGLYLENAFDYMVVQCEYLLERFDLDPHQFRVNLADEQDESAPLSLRLIGWGKIDAWGDISDFLEVESIRTPTGQVISDDEPGGLLVGVAEWLIGQGYLQDKHCPVKPPNARTRFLINSKPNHSNGRNFSSPVKLSNGLYLENAFDDTPQRCVELLEHCGQNPSQFRVNLAEILDEDEDMD